MAKFSYSLGIQSGPILPINHDIDLGATGLYRQVHNLIADKKYKQAINYLKSLINNPLHDQAEVYFLLARVHMSMGKFPEALSFAMTAISKDPDDFQANSCAGECYAQLQMHKEAVDFFLKAQKIRPADSEINRLIGESLLAENHLGGAVKYFIHALEKNKNNNFAWQNLASSLHAQGKVSDAIEASEQYLAAYHQKNNGTITRFEADAHGNHLFMRMAQELRFDKLMQDFEYWASKYACDEYDIPDIRPITANRKIRIGFVGSDFKGHAALSIYRPLFELVDKSKFEIYAYASVVNPDKYTDEVKPCFDRWFNVVSHSDDALFRQIRSDRIDILVDLNGHTANNRLLVFTRKAAPIQITGLGFITPLNIPQIDFYMTDKYITDNWRAKQAHQQIPWFVPSIMHWTRPAGEFEMSPERPHVENGYITFGCANNLYKISERVVGVWAQILKKVPNSRLLIKARQLDCPITGSDLLKRFQSFGVEHSQLSLIGMTSTVGHVKTMDTVDIALDPFPYQGGITTCEALFMGAPVIALDEGTKTSVSILKHCGLSTIASDLNEYIDMAVGISKQLKYGTYFSKEAIRAKFLASPINDPKAYSNSMYKSFEEMFKIYQQAISETNEPVVG